jgi:hypothetical protein
MGYKIYPIWPAVGVNWFDLRRAKPLAVTVKQGASAGIKMQI